MDSKLLVTEMDRIIKEVFADAHPAEQIVAVMTIVGISEYVNGLPLSTKRLVFEVLYKYYALIEGMKK